MQLIIERCSGLAVDQETVAGLPSDRPCGRAAAEGGAHLSQVDGGCKFAKSEKPSPGWPDTCAAPASGHLGQRTGREPSCLPVRSGIVGKDRT